jgi:Sulfotransferase domain
MDPARVVHWEHAAASRPVDWDALFEGFQATVDYPGCQYYRQMLEQYPDAKVVLTVRDPRRWYDSANETIFQAARMLRERREGPPPDFPFPADSPFFPRVIQMIQGDIFGGHFQGKTDDPEFCMEVFRRHNDEVRQVVPDDRLLVYKVKEGWEPLCRFLEVPVPEGEPFPHLNERAEFQRMQRGEGHGPFAGARPGGTH